MSNTQEVASSEREIAEAKFFKKDLLQFFVIVVVLAALIAGLALWDNRSHILANFTTKLLDFFKISF